MKLGLQDRIAVVTGSSAGIGRAIAGALADEGAAVVLSARGAERLEETRAALTSAGAMVEAVVADVSTAAGATEVIQAAIHRFGRIDILVNNAGGSPGPAGFLALADEDWQRAFDDNLMSAVRCARAAIPHMQEQGGGRIINIASTSAHQPDVIVCHYNAAKGGLEPSTTLAMISPQDPESCASANSATFAYDRLCSARGVAGQGIPGQWHIEGRGASPAPSQRCAAAAIGIARTPSFSLC